MEAQLTELLDFVLDPQANVREVATEHILSFSTSQTHEDIINFWIKNAKKLSGLLIEVFRMDWFQNPKNAYNAISALTNFAVFKEFSDCLDSEAFLQLLMSVINFGDTILADPIAMYFSNLTKHEERAIQLVKYPGALNSLSTLFVKGVDKSLNKEASFNFLASVFVNLSVFPKTRYYFLEPSEEDGLLPITRLMVFSEHQDVIRRGGVVSAIKNCCFDTKYHPTILTPGPTDILPYILLPLCGPEEFDDDDMEGMPEDIQLLPDTKKRESDPILRLALVESLILLCSTRDCRETLRQRKVYPVMRNLHLKETDEGVIEAIEKLVNLLKGLEKGEEEKDLDLQNQVKRARLDYMQSEDASTTQQVAPVEEEEEDEDMMIEEIV